MYFVLSIFSRWDECSAFKDNTLDHGSFVTMSHKQSDWSGWFSGLICDGNVCNRVCSCSLYIALDHLTATEPCGMALLCLTLGWTYTAHQRCNKSIPGCQNLSEFLCLWTTHLQVSTPQSWCMSDTETRIRFSLTEKCVTLRKDIGVWKVCFQELARCVCVCKKHLCLNAVFRVG